MFLPIHIVTTRSVSRQQVPLASWSALILATAILVSASAAAGESATENNNEPVPGDHSVESTNAVIGEIVLDKSNVFDLSNPEENNWLYRGANRLHIVTRDKVITKQLLFRSGDKYVPRIVEETERILRGNRYFYDVSIKALQRDDGVVDIKVSTQDVWTLTPELSLSRSGGENRTKFGIEELNLFGRGQAVTVARTDNVDRASTSFEFSDKHLGRSWVSASLRIADNSDGHSNLLSMIRPFYSLDARWSAGASIFDDERRSVLYRLGDEAAEYRHERVFVSAFGGWSAGLKQNHVRRWTYGITYDDNLFSAVPNPTLPAAIPVDRKLVYPFFGVEIVEDRFVKSSNRDQIGRTEDFLMGTRLSAMLGWSDQNFGATTDAVIYQASASRGFGSIDRNALLLAATASGRIASGDTQNTLATLSARYYRHQSEKRLFFATVDVTVGADLDLDNPVQLGGDSGLRGYPLRYQSGDAKILLTVEQRYFTDWYPFRLIRVGGAVFFDAGRTWGENPLGGGSLGWLRDIGLGLRFATTRSGVRKIVHLDIAFPLDGDQSIDDVQILLESKRGF
ncbi:MAG: BamA/TamA family outer membrane protein [Proteobacteria bacterium]|nr:BamA/TamA family outer membrane protein [Pseudomonadota bacterium]